VLSADKVVAIKLGFACVSDPASWPHFNDLLRQDETRQQRTARSAPNKIVGAALTGARFVPGAGRAF